MPKKIKAARPKLNFPTMDWVPVQVRLLGKVRELGMDEPSQMAARLWRPLLFCVQALQRDKTQRGYVPIKFALLQRLAGITHDGVRRGLDALTSELWIRWDVSSDPEYCLVRIKGMKFGDYKLWGERWAPIHRVFIERRRSFNPTACRLYDDMTRAIFEARDRTSPVMLVWKRSFIHIGREVNAHRKTVARSLRFLSQLRLIRMRSARPTKNHPWRGWEIFVLNMPDAATRTGNGAWKDLGEYVEFCWLEEEESAAVVGGDASGLPPPVRPPPDSKQGQGDSTRAGGRAGGDRPNLKASVARLNAQGKQKGRKPR